jgi:hypothetical protein
MSFFSGLYSRQVGFTTRFLPILAGQKKAFHDSAQSFSSISLYDICQEIPDLLSSSLSFSSSSRHLFERLKFDGK